jgi:hypothetical protein
MAAPSHLRRLWNRKRARYAAGALLRGYVVAVYAPDDTAAAKSPKNAGIADTYAPYLCDVQVVEGAYSGILPRVPIMTTVFGVVDRVQYVPRAATIDTKKGNAIKLEGSTSAPATPIHDSDGDLVIIAFLDNDYNKPVIVGALPSVSTRVPVQANANPPKWEAILRGNRIAIEDDGRIVIDATAQTSGVVREDGTEEPASSPKVQIDTQVLAINGNTVTITGDSTTIEAAGTTVRIDTNGVDIGLPAGSKATIGGFSAAGIGEPLVKEGAFADLFGPSGAFWTEALPILTAVGSLFGLPTARLAALAALFGSGKSSSGASLYTDSVESE